MSRCLGSFLCCLALACSSPLSQPPELDQEVPDAQSELDALDQASDTQLDLDLHEHDSAEQDSAEHDSAELFDLHDQSDHVFDAFDTADPSPLPCQIGVVQGVCEDDGACPDDWALALGFCGEAACCFDTAGDPALGQSCAVNGVAGTCLSSSNCVDGHVATPGYCPGPSSIQCCTPRPASGSCEPSLHPQPNLGLVEAAGEGGCPVGMLAIDSFCVDRYEAALDEVLSDTSTRPWSPFHNPGSRRVRARSLAGAMPQGYISGSQAAAACVEAGKRLCTDSEWLRACQGPDGYTFPYGNSRLPGVCNDARSPHPVVELFGSNEAWIWSELDHPCINQLPDSLAATGAHVQCASVEGAFDLMGNLHEWTVDPAGTFRGGFYVDTKLNGDGCLYRTTAHSFAYWDYSTGFRCCADR